MKYKFKKTDRQVGSACQRAGKITPQSAKSKIPTRTFDAIAYAAALEVLG